MRVSDFDYHLPEELIAQRPLERREDSRMLVVDRKAGTWQDRLFRDFPDYLEAGDCLVLNDTRVFPARLLGHRQGMRGEVEVLLVRPISEDGLTWETLARPGRKMRTGERVIFSDQLEADILGRGEYGERILRLHPAGELMETIERVGHIPLPPYIRRTDDRADRERYQTIFARERGSVAAPTAGLHFTQEILENCRSNGAEIAHITLHVGLGTFQPLHSDVLEQVELHQEYFRIREEAHRKIQCARRVIAVGTTSVRALESAEILGRTEGGTGLFIYPGFSFRRTGMLFTNFHLPRSSLLILVCAFGGRELVLDAYHHAVKERYRFYSYGDGMLLI
jgi:S-adenosylmethionine:tRNA ribosyltransferase-isomerase